MPIPTFQVGKTPMPLEPQEPSVASSDKGWSTVGMMQPYTFQLITADAVLVEQRRLDKQAEQMHPDSER